MTLTQSQAQQAVIAVNRFGLGARPGELALAATNPRQWLLRQMTPLQFDMQLANTNTAFEMMAGLRAMQKRQRSSSAAMADGKLEDYRKQIRQVKQSLLTDSLWQSVETSQPFAMRLVDFFSNHFSVSTSTQPLHILAPLLEREAIAPHVFGRFEDMLIAVIQHPAMLVYLDNPRSTGPNSRVARNVKPGNKKRGLNENLAREIFELHTLGVDGSYGLADIQELAKAITGWSVSRPHEFTKLGFVYREDIHEPGERRILTKSYKEVKGDKGVRQGEKVLRDLARHPATAAFVSFKLAQWLVSDQPDPALLGAMEASWRKTNGDLCAVITTLVEHPVSWHAERQKLKTPREFVVSTLRAIGAEQHSINNRQQRFAKGIVYHLMQMGQAPFNAGSPAGYSQLAQDWSGSDALMKRIDWVNILNTVIPKMGANVLEISQQVLAGQVSERTLRMLNGAETQRQGRTLLFMSPEFQRR